METQQEQSRGQPGLSPVRLLFTRYALTGVLKGHAVAPAAFVGHLLATATLGGGLLL